MIPPPPPSPAPLAGSSLRPARRNRNAQVVVVVAVVVHAHASSPVAVAVARRRPRPRPRPRPSAAPRLGRTFRLLLLLRDLEGKVGEREVLARLFRLPQEQVAGDHRDAERRPPDEVEALHLHDGNDVRLARDVAERALFVFHVAVVVLRHDADDGVAVATRRAVVDLDAHGRGVLVRVALGRLDARTVERLDELARQRLLLRLLAPGKPFRVRHRLLDHALVEVLRPRQRGRVRQVDFHVLALALGDVLALPVLPADAERDAARRELHARGVARRGRLVDVHGRAAVAVLHGLAEDQVVKRKVLGRRGVLRRDRTGHFAVGQEAAVVRRCHVHEVVRGGSGTC
ncbi:MAG: hypothetical protein CMF70_06795 [Magnetovibrio sp.]|nr:hypothetical protein [Magnetovibrio sp.]